MTDEERLIQAEANGWSDLSIECREDDTTFVYGKPPGDGTYREYDRVPDDPLKPYRVSWDEAANELRHEWRMQWAREHGWTDVAWAGDNSIGWALVGTTPGGALGTPVPMEIPDAVKMPSPFDRAQAGDVAVTGTPTGMSVESNSPLFIQKPQPELAILDVINALRAVVLVLRRRDATYNDAETLLNLLAEAERKLQLP